MSNTEQVMISSEETYRDNHGGPESTTSDTVINVSDAAQSATEAHTSIRRQWQAARSNSSSNSSTACFGFDTPVLTETQGFAQREMFYQAEKGELPPSGNIMDLTGALTTPIKTLCCFDTQKGDNDIVKMGICTHVPAQCSYMRTYAHERTRLHIRQHSWAYECRQALRYPSIQTPCQIRIFNPLKVYKCGVLCVCSKMDTFCVTCQNVKMWDALSRFGPEI